MRAADIAKALGGATRSGRGWLARCPAPGHGQGRGDRTPSLSLADGDGGKLLVHCHAGCDPRDVLAELRERNLLDEPDRDARPWRSARDTAPHPAAGMLATIDHQAKPGEIVATYGYHDEAGALLFQVVRLEPKSFRQRRPDGNGGWSWSVNGVRQVPYRLFELRAKVAHNLVFIVEGEKDVDRLAALGVVATCNAGGAGKWPAELTECLRGADVVILPDNDPPGRKHAEVVAEALHGTAERVRIVALPGIPPKGDVSDWLDAGGTLAQLFALGDLAPPWGADHDPEQPVALPALPDSFWASRPYLAAIRDFARSQRAAPGAVLIQVLVRAAVGAPGTPVVMTDAAGVHLTLYGITIAPSGAGKTGSTRASRLIVDLTAAGIEVVDAPIGSGEGIAEAYMGEAEVDAGGGKKPVTQRQQVRNRVHFHLDEGEALLKLLRRDGATIGETLRRAFTGEPLGQQNATAERTRVVRDYTLGVTINCTPGSVAGILAHAETGLPQRFLWASGIDPSAPEHPREVLAIALPPVRGRIAFAPEILAEINKTRHLALTGRSEVPELDAHLPLIRARVAAILAAWDMRDEANIEDWRLAGIIVSTSCAVRDAAMRQAETIGREERAQFAVERGEVAQVVRAMTDIATEQVDGLARRVARRVRKANAPMTRRAIRDACFVSRERVLFSPAIDLAKSRSWIIEREGGIVAGPSDPAL